MDTVEVDVKIKHETDQAYLLDNDSEEVWLPKSQCEFEPSQKNPRVGVMTVPRGLAEKKGLV